MKRTLILQEIDLPGAELYYVKNFIDNSSDVYDTLQKEVPWKQEKVIIMGKEYDARRLTCFLGEEGKSYFYSGIERIPEKMTDTLKDIMKRVQTIVDNVREHPKYTSTLANYYLTGENSIGMHSDDETTLVPDSIIASVSIGAVRHFDIYCKKTGKKVMRLELEDGSLLLMGKNMQKLYKHAVPVQKKIKDGRINLTFRCIKEN